jgi:hypothetical protein
MTCARRRIRVKRRQTPSGFLVSNLWVLTVTLSLIAVGGSRAQTSSGMIQDITGNYHFLGPNDTLALLEEEGMLKGYIDVLQGQSESDVVMSYPITLGSRKGDHVEFRTRRIHEMYYRFSGTVQRGTGRKQSDPGYLELVGDLQIITRDSTTEKEVVDRRQVVFKSEGESQ